MSAFRPPGECPACGEFVPKGARACPGCGSDARTGWNEDSGYDGLDLPESAFDDEAAPTRSRPSRARSAALDFLYLGIAILLALVLSGVWFVFRH